MESREVQIPVPWGYVAGKSWGDEKKKLVVAFHGFQDSANSFDKIIPFLSKSFHYVCFDFPSHGKSSHLDSKSLVSAFDFVLTIKILLDNLKQDKYIIMGHSFGAAGSILFTQMYPERVKKLIIFDCVYYLPTEPEQFIDTIRAKFKSYSQRYNRYFESAPKYSREEVVDKLGEGRNTSEDIAELFFERAVLSVEDNKYKFTHAQHLKYMVNPTISLQFIIDLMKAFPIKCPHLLIRASQSKLMYDYYHEVLEIFKSTNKSFEMYEVKGPHDIHIEKPEIVAEYVNKFLLRNKL